MSPRGKQRRPAKADVAEYFFRVEQVWKEFDLGVEPPPSQACAYDLDAGGPSYSVGQIDARLTFPSKDDIFVDVWEIVRSEGYGFHRLSYAYELVANGARVECWHRHKHASDHQHRASDNSKIPIKAISHKQMVEACLAILWGDPFESEV